jgi:thymidylate kinase
MTMVVVSVAEKAERRCSVSHFLTTLFTLLDGCAIRYCVLHGWQNLPTELPSDLDLAVHPQDAQKLPRIILGLSNEGYLPVQELHYAVRSYRYDFAWVGERGMEYAGVDITYEYREGGLILLSAISAVRDRQRHGNFWIASPATELTYVLAKKTCKGAISLTQQQRLKQLVTEMGAAAEHVVSSLFGPVYSSSIVQACKQGQLPALLPTLRKRLWWTTFRREPLNPLRNRLGNAWRLARRWMRPTGLLVVLLGPDGVGKSTVKTELHQAVAPAFRGFRAFHWRPMLLHPRGEAVVHPHSESPRGLLKSIAVCGVLLLDYWLGYLLLVRPVVSRTGLVVFDRYFHDILSDPLRYRYGGPHWWLRTTVPLVPQSNTLFIVLDADEELILSRKHEVSPGELKRQRDAYLRLAAELKSTPIRTDAGVEATVQAVTQQIIEWLGKRFQRRHAHWLYAGEMTPDSIARSTTSV